MQKQYEDRDVAVVLANVSITASKIRDNCQGNIKCIEGSLSTYKDVKDPAVFLSWDFINLTNRKQIDVKKKRQ